MPSSVEYILKYIQTALVQLNINVIYKAWQMLCMLRK